MENQDTCPFCRTTIQEKNWTPVGINVGYKISVICDTLRKCKVNWISIEEEEFSTLQVYFEDYTHNGSITTEIGNPCLCNVEGKGRYHGFNKRIIIDLNLYNYYEFYVCSYCADLNPCRIWNKMLEGKVSSILFEPKLDLLRDGLILLMHSRRGYVYKLSDWNRIEKVIFGCYLEEKGYLNLTEYKFIVNLLRICSGNMYINEQSIFNFMLKYLSKPFSEEWSVSYFNKFFLKEAWTNSVKCKGFLGLYPTISLWNIIRDPEAKFAEKSDTYDGVEEYKRGWLLETGLSSK